MVGTNPVSYSGSIARIGEDAMCMYNLVDVFKFGAHANGLHDFGDIAAGDVGGKIREHLVHIVYRGHMLFDYDQSRSGIHTGPAIDRVTRFGHQIR